MICWAPTVSDPTEQSRCVWHSYDLNLEFKKHQIYCSVLVEVVTRVCPISRVGEIAHYLLEEMLMSQCKKMGWKYPLNHLGNTFCHDPAACAIIHVAPNVSTISLLLHICELYPFPHTHLDITYSLC